MTKNNSSIYIPDNQEEGQQEKDIFISNKDYSREENEQVKNDVLKSKEFEGVQKKNEIYQTFYENREVFQELGKAAGIAADTMSTMPRLANTVAEQRKEEDTGPLKRAAEKVAQAGQGITPALGPAGVALDMIMPEAKPEKRREPEGEKLPEVDFSKTTIENPQSTEAVHNWWQNAPTTVEERKQAMEETIGEDLLKDPPEVPDSYKEPGFIGQFVEGLKRGWRSSIDAGSAYGVEALGQVVGSSDLINWGQKQGDEAMREIIKRPELAPPEDMKPFFKGGFTDPSKYARTIGETLPYMGAVIGNSLIGGAAGYALGGPTGATIGARTLGGATSYELASGNYYNELIQEGHEPQKAAPLSQIYGGTVAITENMMGVKPTALGSNVSKGMMRTTANSWKNFLKKELKHVSMETLKQMQGEGAEEVIQGLAGNYLKKWVDEEAKVITPQLAEEGVAGAVAAIPFGATNVRIPQIEPGETNVAAADSRRQTLLNLDEALEDYEPPKTQTGEINFPTADYQFDVLQEINEMEDLPQPNPEAVEWTPPTKSFDNFYTRNMYKLLSKGSKAWDSYGPDALKIGSTQDITNLIKERGRIYHGLLEKYSEEFVKPIEKLSTEKKEQVGKMIFKTIPVPEEAQPAIKDIDSSIGQLGKKIVELEQDLVDEGLMKENRTLMDKNTWQQNVGRYARTLYVEEEEGGDYSIEPNSPINSDGVVQDSAFKRKLTDAEWGANSLKFQGKTEEEIETYSLEKLREIGRKAKEDHGWTTQADFVLAQTYKNMVSVYANRQFQAAIARNPDLFSNTEKEGFVPVEDLMPSEMVIQTPEGPKTVSAKKQYGPLADGYIHPGLEEELQSFVRTEKSGGGFFSELLSWWKAERVAANVPTVVRNWIENAIFKSDLAGYPTYRPKNATLYNSAVKDYITKSDFYKKMRDNGLYGADYYAAEIAADIDLEEVGSIRERAANSNNPMKTYAYEMAKKIENFDDLQERFAEGQSDARQKLFKYYGHIDHLGRTFLAKAAMKDGASPAEAVRFANKWALNYRYTPQIVDRMRKGVGGAIFPFMSFYALNTPRVAEVALTRPWVLAKYPIAVAATNAVSRQMLGVDREEVETAKPEFIKNEKYTVLLPERDKNGNMQFLNLGYTLPIGGPSTGFVDFKQATNMLRSGGMYGVVQGMLNNHDPFSNRKIYDKADPDSVKRKKVRQYLMRKLGPGVVGDAMDIWDAAQGKKTGAPVKQEMSLKNELMQTFGVSVYPGGFNQSYWKLRKEQRAIQHLEQGIGDIISNPNISEEEKNKRIREYQKEMKERIKKLKEIGKNMPPINPKEETEEGEEGGGGIYIPE